MSDDQSTLNARWFIPMLLIAMSGFLFLKGPAANNAQFIFRVGTLVVGLVLLVVLNLPRRGTGGDD